MYNLMYTLETSRKTEEKIRVDRLVINGMVLVAEVQLLLKNLYRAEILIFNQRA